ncbi:M56 family metallopeptidase [Taibaiella soli]|uniref:Peptidase M56 domain-containing protein n=1 Tax=Taibaiella soli TaxID=1649169 RepID=A0A2W2B1G3_9BACT|nr:M56 family metallopeptidase [Taibaiella soli]PZF73838.1 hypothetical protein DN068_05705 [Taibaiella soli]
MITFLINCTAIWLVSLVCFDLFLKRDTHHSWNRSYLLVTLISGLVAPFIKWSPATTSANSLSNALQIRSQHSRQALVDTITPAANITIPWTQILFWTYLIGAGISVFFLLREIFIISKYYRRGEKTKEDNWTIVRTNLQHGPFSIFHFIFISSENNWDTGEYEIVLNHEKAHCKQFHAVDLCLLQLLQIVLWFHPLVYLYRSRLILVHEYQADASVPVAPKQYGNFLLNQFMLQQTPSFSHSFYHSPIKKRVLMITQSASSKLSRAKYLLVAPLLIVTVVCCSKSQYNNERKKEGNKITYKGNVFEMSNSSFDTLQVTDATTGKISSMITQRLPYPIKVNGNPIMEDNEVSQKAVYKGVSATPGEDLFKFIKSDMGKLPDGDYVISVTNPVIDEQGRLVYFEESVNKQGIAYTVDDIAGKPGITANPKDLEKTDQIENSAADAINKRIDFYLSDESLKFTPATQHGKVVASTTSNLFGFMGLNVTVKNHQASLVTE